MWTRRQALAVPGALWADASLLQREPKGWKDILPGKKLAGWTRLPMPADGPLHKEVEVWKVDAGKRVLSCFGHLPAGGQPKPGSHEFFRYDRELTDFVFHVEWRYVDPARDGWNSGVYARNSADGRVWHQAQTPGKGKVFWFGNSPDASGNVVRQKFEAPEATVAPPGEWNVYEIAARGDRLDLWCNGANVCSWTGLRVPKGYIGLEAEYHHAEFRNLRLKTG